MAKLGGKYSPKAPGMDYLPTFAIKLRQMWVNKSSPMESLGYHAWILWQSHTCINHLELIN